MEKEIYKLTAAQIKTLDEINFDKYACKETLNIALNHAENRQNELMRAESKMWEDIADSNEVEFEGGYKITKTLGGMYAVPMDYKA